MEFDNENVYDNMIIVEDENFEGDDTIVPKVDMEFKKKKKGLWLLQKLWLCHLLSSSETEFEKGWWWGFEIYDIDM